MTGSQDQYRVAFVEGDVTLSHDQFGVSSATRGMTFADVAGMTIRTGVSSRVIVITPRGHVVDIGEMSHETFAKRPDFADTLSRIYVTARDMRSARRIVTLQTVANL